MKVARGKLSWLLTVAVLVVVSGAGGRLIYLGVQHHEALARQNARRQAVRGRADRCADDETVAGVTGHAFAVQVDPAVMRTVQSVREILHTVRVDFANRLVPFPRHHELASCRATCL